MSNIVVEANKLASMWQYKSRGIDNANKAEFDVFYDRVKFVEGREAQVKAHKEASKAIVSDTQRKGFVAMLNLAVDYVEINTVCTYSLIEWEVLKKAVRLHKYVVKHHDEEAQEIVRNKMDTVFTKGISPERYNNGLNALLDTLKEEYTVEPKAEDVYTRVFNDVSKLDDNAKEAILLSLMEELGYEVGYPEESVA